MTDVQLVAYLLAKDLGLKTNTAPMELIGEAKAFWGEANPRAEKTTVSKEDVERIYGLYPTEDKNNQCRPITKGKKAREKIAMLLRTRSADSLYDEVYDYIAKCSTNGAYIKDFTTFLNNVEAEDSATEVSTIPLDQTSIFV